MAEKNFIPINMIEPLKQKKNPKLLKEFLTRTLKREVEIIEFLRNELPVVSTVDKVKTVDVLVKVDGEYIHIEINANNKDYIPTRNFIYYLLNKSL